MGRREASVSPCPNVVCEDKSQMTGHTPCLDKYTKKNLVSGKDSVVYYCQEEESSLQLTYDGILKNELKK